MENKYVDSDDLMHSRTFVKSINSKELSEKEITKMTNIFYRKMSNINFEKEEVEDWGYAVAEIIFHDLSSLPIFIGRDPDLSEHVSVYDFISDLELSKKAKEAYRLDKLHRAKMLDEFAEIDPKFREIHKKHKELMKLNVDSYQLKYLLDKMKEFDPKKFHCEVNSPDNNYYIGVLPEIIKHKHIYTLSSGNWDVYDYFDHMWTLLVVNTKTDPQEELSFHRLTEGDAQYGFILRKALTTIEKDCRYNREDIKDLDSTQLNLKEHEGFITFGRGDSEYKIYLAKNDDENVIAFMITTVEFLEMLKEMDDEKKSNE